MKTLKNVITQKMKKELEEIEGTYKDLGDIEGTCEGLIEKVEEVVKSNKNNYKVWESEYGAGWGAIFVGNEKQYAIVEYSDRVSEYDEQYIELTRVEEHIQPKKFTEDLYHWIDNHVISKRMEYFSTKEDLFRFIKKNGGLGVVNFDEEVLAGITPWGRSDSGDLCVEWAGRGFYIGWCWGEAHIQKIEEAYDELIIEYQSKGFGKPSDNEVNKLFETTIM